VPGANPAKGRDLLGKLAVPFIFDTYIQPAHAVNTIVPDATHVGCVVFENCYSWCS
jgi:hypothetical protein